MGVSRTTAGTPVRLDHDGFAGPRRAALWGAAALAVAWAAALPWSAYTLRASPSSPWRLGVSVLIYRAGSLVCHQDPTRSFRVAAWPLPVCARCAGLYAGGAVAAAAAAGVLVRRRRQPGRGRAVVARMRALLIVAAVPTAALWAAERLAGMPVSNEARAAGAVPLGGAVAWVLARLIAGDRLTDGSHTSGIH